ncbi:MAG: DnaJ domain-containing protein [Polyangiales bacterium]
MLLSLHRRGMGGTLAVWRDDGGPGQDRILLQNGIVVGARLTEAAGSLERGILPIFRREAAAWAFYNLNLLGEGPNVHTGRVHPHAIVAAAVRGGARADVMDAVLDQYDGKAVRLVLGFDVSQLGLVPKEQTVLELLRAEPATVGLLVQRSGEPKVAKRMLYLLSILQGIEVWEGAPALASGGMSEGEGAHGGLGLEELPLLDEPPPGISEFPSAFAGLFEDTSTPKPPSQSSAPRPKPPSSSPGMPRPSGSPSSPGFARPSAVPSGSALPPLAGSPSSPNVQRPPSYPPAAGPASSSGSVAPKRASVLPPPTGSAAAKAHIRIPTGPTLPPPPSEALPPELAARWRELAHEAAARDTKNYFEMLGVPENTDAGQVRDAYFTAVKKWHPDRLPPDLAGLRPFAEEIFRILTEAKDTLSDDEKRLRYLKTVRGGGGTPASDRQLLMVLTAAQDYEKANILANLGKYDEALSLLEAVLILDPEQADYHALKAWVLYNVGLSRPAVKTQDVIALCDQALARAQGGYHERALYTKGLSLKRLAKEDQAIHCFRAVADKNPKHVEAAREIRLFEMRSRNGKTEARASKAPDPGTADPTKPGGGLLSRLFGNKKP